MHNTPHSPETIALIKAKRALQSPTNKGRKFSEEWRRNMSIARKGKIVGLATREKLRNFRLGKTGERSTNWKGGISNRSDYYANLNVARRAKKKSNGGSHTLGEWENLKAQYNWTCPCCKRKEPEIKLSQDHIIALSKGGTDNIENIQPLCRSCNSKKHSKTIQYTI